MTPGNSRGQKIGGSHMAALLLGRRLIAARTEAGLTQEQAVIMAELSLTTLERTEHGQRQVDAGEVWKLCQAYGLSGDTLNELVELAKATKADDGWFQNGDELPRGWSLYGELEGAAAAIRAYEPFVIFGLLQTPAYARAIIESVGGLSTPEIDRRLAFRLERQRAVLRHPAPQLHVVLAGSALEVAVGSAATLAEQLDHLRTLAQQSHVDIRVRPPAAGHHPDLGGPFTHLTFTDDELPPMAYIETYLGGKLIEKGPRIGQLANLFEATASESTPIGEYL